MSGLNSIMDNSLSALFSARVALETVSHNIANANTPGYSRQEVLFSARRPVRFTYGSQGRGVQIDGIRRATDRFLIENFRAQSAKLASFSQQDASLREIEAIFGSVENDHLGAAINAFFNAWSDLATPPSDTAMKQAVISAAQALAGDFQTTSRALDELEANLAESVTAEVARLNGLFSEVTLLNEQIIGNQSRGVQPNDLYDQRDLLIAEIAKIAAVDTIEREDGSLDVIMGGRTVVSRTYFQPLREVWVHKPGGSQMQIYPLESKTALSLPEGELGGLLTAINGQVNGTRAGLDEIANLIITRVNELHVQGRSGSGGIAFFTGEDASSMGINPAILENYNLVATSRSGEAGDNDIADAIANLAHTPLTGDGSDSLLDRYRVLLTNLAGQRSRFEFLVENQQNMVIAVEGRLESVRGVSLDEEGANLVRYQNAYDAAARVITAVQEMFDTLLEMTQ